MIPGQPYKQCPTCKTPAEIDAPQCASCGHQFRTKFAPAAANQTMAFSPPDPVADPYPKTRATPLVDIIKWGLVGWSCLCALWFLFALWNVTRPTNASSEPGAAFLGFGVGVGIILAIWFALAAPMTLVFFLIKNTDPAPAVSPRNLKIGGITLLVVVGCAVALQLVEQAAIRAEKDRDAAKALADKQAAEEMRQRQIEASRIPPELTERLNGAFTTQRGSQRVILNIRDGRATFMDGRVLLDRGEIVSTGPFTGEYHSSTGMTTLTVEYEDGELRIGGEVYHR